MEADDQGRTTSNLSRGVQADIDDKTLQAKMTELIKTKEELKRAKESAMQSWLDSKPVIDELEKLQSVLASAKNRTSMSSIIILELESQLEAINANIKSKVEEELKATKMTNETTREIDKTGNELEKIKQDTDEKRRERSTLKQVLRTKRQSLRTAQLTLRAVQIESEAFGASAAEALQQLKSSETNSSVIHVTQQEYYALIRRAKEETSVAEWRISVSMEQKLAAEANRNLALSRLADLDAENNSRRTREKEGKIIEHEHFVTEEEEPEPRVKADVEVNRGNPFPKARAKAAAEPKRKDKQKMMRRPTRGHGKKFPKKKKLSVFSRLRNFLVKSFTRLFG